MSRLHDIKTGKKKKHSCTEDRVTGCVENQKFGKNQPHRKIYSKIALNQKKKDR